MIHLHPDIINDLSRNARDAMNHQNTGVFTALEGPDETVVFASNGDYLMAQYYVYTGLLFQTASKNADQVVNRMVDYIEHYRDLNYIFNTRLEKELEIEQIDKETFEENGFTLTDSFIDSYDDYLLASVKGLEDLASQIMEDDDAETNN